MDNNKKGEAHNDWSYVSVYTRADAIRDGELVDVSCAAREAGIRYPVALTRAVYWNHVDVPDGVVGQDEAGRLWDILWMCRVHIQRNPGPLADEIRFRLSVQNNKRRSTRVELKCICHPGDNGEPVLTISLPDED
ncbi:MAG: hypothetical protein KDA60_02010 [Planctomycetales bacterium]|nr:hypothetical protein [Planctomycetales bacterium]